MERGGAGLRAEALMRVGSCAVSGVTPVFLYGALAVLIREDLGFGPTRLGMAAAGFFVSTAVASSAAGRFTDRVGDDRAMALAIITSTLSLCGMAVLTRSWWHVLAFLALGGVGNALAQPATSAAVASLVPSRRHGIAFGAKQMNGPMATMLAGLLTPLVAVPLGWRAAFVAGTVVSVPFWLARGGRRLPRIAAVRVAPHRRLSSPELRLLRLAAMLGATTATTLGTFYVSSAVEVGIRPGHAAALLALGSGAGVVGRLGWGWLSDSGRMQVIRLLAAVMGAGAISFLLLATSEHGGMLAVATVATFATAWSWPGVLLHTIVRAHPDRAAGATGYVLAGVAAGGAAGPPFFGAVVEATSYRTGWFTAAGALAAGAAVVVAVGPRVSGPRPSDPSGDAAPPN